MKLVCRVLLVLAFAAPTLAHADDPRAHFARGTAFQDRGQYAEAIAEYEAAYAQVQLPELLFNIAQCHRLKGDPAQALAFYRRYLEASPDGRGADEARRHVATLEQVSPPPAEVVESPAPPVVEARPVEAPPPAVTPPVPVADDRLVTAPRLRWTGVGLGVAGAVSGGLGLYFYLRMNDLEDEVAAQVGKDGGWSDAAQRLGEDGETAERRSTVFSWVGGGLAVAGAGLFVYSYYLGEPGEGVAFVPAIGPGEASLGLSGRF